MTYQVVITTEYWIDADTVQEARDQAISNFSDASDRGVWEVTFIGKPVFENGGVVDYEDVTDD
jgi:hypothetical protein